MAKHKGEQTRFTEAEPERKPSGPVECLGMTFENDEKRREHFLEILREKLKDPEFRKTEGFPIGEDEDILAISDPPYYTACPNPFLGDFVMNCGTPYDPSEDYSREPFAVDVSVGKTDQLYKAHGYHTKVPHLAIIPPILHYTKPGDVILDGFCGSGMTGVAAEWCGWAPAEYRLKLEGDWRQSGQGVPEWGRRHAILGDLGPSATFIAANYNISLDVEAFAEAAKGMLSDVDQELGWMHETIHTDGGTRARINYTVWSEVLACPECSREIEFFEEAVERTTGKVRSEFACPHCGVNVTKNGLIQLKETMLDEAIGKAIKTPKRRPVLVNYSIGSATFEKRPDEKDMAVLHRVGRLSPPGEIPVDAMMHSPSPEKCWGDKWRAGTASFTHVHHLFLPRVCQTIAALWRRARAVDDVRLRNMLLFWLDSQLANLSILNRYRPHVSFPYNPLSGVYYVSSLISEPDPVRALRNKLKRIVSGFAQWGTHKTSVAVTTGDCASIPIPANSIDYVFTDPPFGDNLAYAELNFVAEAFHRCFTEATPEAIVSPYQKKSLQDYQQLMGRCFREYSRVLKPGRWMTVVFHNSRNSVWTAIQESLQSAGLVVADVRVLDKRQGSFNQAVAVGSVKQDLVISSYKPNGGLEERFRLDGGSEQGAWDFARTHLGQLPVFVSVDGRCEVIAERQSYLLFDRMVAFHVQRGVRVPLSASEFYGGLEERFPSRDGMYFLPEQAAEYDRRRMTVKEVLQLELFVCDEATAIQWLHQQMIRKPQTFQEIHPQFLKEIGGWQKHEKPLELSEMLQENFLRYDGKDEVPSQIHSYLSTNFRPLRNLGKDDPALKAKAKDRWYVPDPNKAGDLEKLRERTLLREFQDYRESRERRLKVFRLEAVRAGFKKAWQEADYGTIIKVAEKIPENVLQEDPKLLMWYDQAVTRTGDGT